MQGGAEYDNICHRCNLPIGNIGFIRNLFYDLELSKPKQAVVSKILKELEWTTYHKVRVLDEILFLGKGASGDFDILNHRNTMSDEVKEIVDYDPYDPIIHECDSQQHLLCYDKRATPEYKSWLENIKKYNTSCDHDQYFDAECFVKNALDLNKRSDIDPSKVTVANLKKFYETVKYPGWEKYIKSVIPKPESALKKPKPVVIEPYKGKRKTMLPEVSPLLFAGYTIEGPDGRMYESVKHRGIWKWILARDTYTLESSGDSRNDIVYLASEFPNKKILSSAGYTMDFKHLTTFRSLNGKWIEEKNVNGTNEPEYPAAEYPNLTIAGYCGALFESVVNKHGNYSWIDLDRSVQRVRNSKIFVFNKADEEPPYESSHFPNNVMTGLRNGHLYQGGPTWTIIQEKKEKKEKIPKTTDDSVCKKQTLAKYVNRKSPTILRKRLSKCKEKRK
jgi:hypothetical protein